MAGPLWRGYYGFNKVQPFDLQVFRHVILNENGICSPRNLVGTFYQFRNEIDVVQGIWNLPNTHGRQLLQVEKAGKEILVNICLNGVDVCKKYGYGRNCNQGCKRLHVCLYFLKGHCKREGNCPQSHNIYDQHNWNILCTNYLADLDRNEIFVALRCMVTWTKRKNKTNDPDDALSVASEVESVTTLDDVSEELTRDGPPDQVERKSNDDVFSSMATSPTASAEVKRYEVVHHVLSKHNGQCKYLDLIGKENLGFKNKKEIQSYINHGRGQGAFTILKKSGGDVIVVDLKAEICVDYNNNLACQNNDCNKLHICYLYVEGICLNRNQCNRYHNFHNVHNRNVLKKLLLEDLRDNDILHYLKIKLQDSAEEGIFEEKSILEHHEEAEITNDVQERFLVTPDPIQFVNRLTVLRFLLRQEGGICSLIEFSCGTGFSTEQAAVDWINSEANTVCKVYHPQDGQDSLVVTSVQYLVLCSAYQITTHACSGCEMLHLCRDHLAGKCSRQPCKSIHWIKHSRNTAALEKARVDSLNKEEMFLAIQYSLPRVCSEYNSASGCTRSVCTNVHICARYVNNKCSSEKNCEKDHTLTSPHNKNLESIFGQQIQCVFNLIPPSSTRKPSVKSSQPVDLLENLKESEVAQPVSSVRKLTMKNSQPVDPLQNAKEIQAAHRVSISKMMSSQFVESKEYIQNNVIQCLLSAPDGISRLSDIHQSLKTEFATSDLLNWLTSPTGKKICVVQNATLILMKINRFQLCFGYSSNRGCLDTKCTYLHLCTEFINGNCQDGENCNFSHDVQNSHNQNIVKSSGLDFETQEDVITAIRNSLPKVCERHNFTGVCADFSCGKFHLCVNYVRKMCLYSACMKGHDFDSPHNKELLSVLGYPENVAFRILQQTLPPKKRSIRKIEDKGRDDKENKPLNTKDAILEAMCMEFILPNMLMNHDGLCTFNQFVELFPEHLSDDEVLDLLKRPTIQKYMRLLKTDSQGRTMVLARMQDIGLCYAYCGKNGCKRGRCSYLHLCRSFIAGYCSRREECKLSHNTEERQNAKVLDAAGLPKSIPEDLALQLIRNSLPRLCLDHIKGEGCNRDFCYKFHICSHYIKRCCRRSPEECRFGHSFNTSHNEEILKMFSYTVEEINGKVLAPDFKPSKRESESSAPEYKSTSAPRPVVPQIKSLQLASCEMEATNNILKEKRVTDIHSSEKPIAPPRTKRKTNLEPSPSNSTLQKPHTLTVSESHSIAVTIPSISSGQVDLTCGATLKRPPIVPLLSIPTSAFGTNEKKTLTIPSIDGYSNTTARMASSREIMIDLPTASFRPNDTLASTPNLFRQENIKLVSQRIESKDPFTSSSDTIEKKIPAVPSPDQYRNITRRKASSREIMIDFPPALVPSNEKLELESQPKLPREENLKAVSERIESTDPCTELKLLLKHHSSPSIPICHKFIAKSCYDQQCHMHHHPMPYLWCYMVNNGWKDFDSKISQMIEEQYCKPDKMYFTATFADEDMTVDFEDKKGSDQHARIFSAIFPRRWKIMSNVEDRVCRLSTISYMESGENSKFTTVWKWYWQDNSDWKEYGADGEFPYQDVIEAKYVSKKTEEIVFENGPSKDRQYTYKMHLINGCQVNTTFGTTRPIQRRPIFVSEAHVTTGKISLPVSKYRPTDLPKDWVPMDTTNKGYDLIPLTAANQEYHSVKKLYNKTMSSRGCEILEIFKVQNILLWQTFTRHKEDLERFNQTSPELKLLFHGTDDEDIVRGICYQNFDPRMHGKHATLYGKGAYFARDASYSHNYTASTGKRYMFLADVLVGEYTKGDSNMQRPPKKPGQSSNRQYELYDSTVDDVYNPSIFVIYGMEKCYPSYLILYKEKGAQVNWKTYQEGYSHGVGPYMDSSHTGAYYRGSSYPGSLPQKTSMSTSSALTPAPPQKPKCSIQ